MSKICIFIKKKRPRNEGGERGIRIFGPKYLPLQT